MPDLSDDIFAETFSQDPWWWEAAAPVEMPSTEISQATDVVVIGSGYAGLSCAHELARNGTNVIVVDAGSIGIGASTRAAGLLSGRAGVSKQINLEAAVGADQATRILDEADEAYEYFQNLIATENIDCHFQNVGRFVGAHTPAAYDKLAKKADEYNSDSRGAFRMVSRAEQHNYIGSDYYFGGMFTEAAGLVHSSLYHRGLLNLCEAAGVRFLPNARVEVIESNTPRKRVHTSQGVIEAKDVVLATNGYTDKSAPWHQRRIIPISSTIVATEEIGEDRVSALLPQLCAVIDAKRIICFARPSPDRKRILFGGRARFHPITTEEATKILYGQLCEMFPEMQGVKVTNTWTGYMGFTFDFLPKMGEHDGMHYAIGCNGGCGIVMMSWLGRQVARKIAGTANRPSAYEAQPFKTQPFYGGKPWFLPVVGNYYRFRDWLELRSVRHLR